MIGYRTPRARAVRQGGGEARRPAQLDPGPPLGAAAVPHPPPPRRLGDHRARRPPAPLAQRRLAGGGDGGGARRRAVGPAQLPRRAARRALRQRRRPPRDRRRPRSTTRSGPVAGLGGARGAWRSSPDLTPALRASDAAADRRSLHVVSLSFSHISGLHGALWPLLCALRTTLRDPHAQISFHHCFEPFHRHRRAGRRRGRHPADPLIECGGSFSVFRRPDEGPRRVAAGTTGAPSTSSLLERLPGRPHARRRRGAGHFQLRLRRLLAQADLAEPARQSAARSSSNTQSFSTRSNSGSA